jgi:hypothetical protein
MGQQKAQDRPQKTEQKLGQYSTLEKDKLSKRTTHFDDIAEDFFAYHGSWAQNKILAGMRLSEKWCETKQSFVDTHLIPISAQYSLITSLNNP